MKFLNANDVCCFSPHPDDCEYSISGTVKKYFDTKFHIFNFSSGGKFSSAKQASERISEVKSFWSEFENVRMNFFNNKFIRDIETDEYILKLDKIFSNKFYNFILIPPSHDTHQDHRKINEVANSIVRSSNIGLIEYMTPSTKVNWSSNFFVDISNEVDFKKKLLFSSFKTQSKKPYFTDEVFNAFHSNFQASKRKILQVESFRILNMYA